MSPLPETPRKPEKASFDNLYDRPHPGRYFSALRPLKYRIPGHAQPVIEECVSALTEIRKQPIRILDLCSGYGINGALLKHDLSMEDLYELYDDSGPVPHLARRIARDRDFLETRRHADRDAYVIGQDVAANALDYAQSVGSIDAAIKANLERRPLRRGEADLVAEVDLITVTGGLSYIGAATFKRILDEVKRPPWVLYFPLQHTPDRETSDTIVSFGLDVEEGAKPVPQRHFKDERERNSILPAYDRSAAVPRDWPFGTYLEAKLCLARPAADIGALPLRRLLSAAFDGDSLGAETAA